MSANAPLPDWETRSAAKSRPRPPLSATHTNHRPPQPDAQGGCLAEPILGPQTEHPANLLSADQTVPEDGQETPQNTDSLSCGRASATPIPSPNLRLPVAWLLTALVMISALIALTLGPADIRLSELAGVLGQRVGLGGAEVSPLRAAIIWELRLPRILVALAAGAGLALTGALMQALTRNPLADPYLLGLSSGAALGAVLTLLAGASLLLPLGAFLGSLAALILALSIARLLGGASPSRAILAGICISALASAATSGLIFWTATGDSYREILSWLMGSLAGSLWQDAALALLALALCAPIILIAGRALDAFTFGETAAASLGVDVARLRWLLLLSSALLTGIMVALGGAIGFVGLVVPHAVRLLTGAGHRRLLPSAMLAGALFLLWADTAARTLFAPRELPVGIVTALVGAPIFFLVLLRYRHRT